MFWTKTCLNMLLWKCKSPRFSISYFPNITKIIGFFDLSYHCNYFFFFLSFVSNSHSKQKLTSLSIIICLVAILLMLFSLFLTSLEILNYFFLLNYVRVVNIKQCKMLIFCFRVKEKKVTIFITFYILHL